MPLFETSEISEENLAEIKDLIRKKWNLELQDCIKVSQNHTYKATDECDLPSIVRITPCSDTNFKENLERIEVEIHFLNYLKKNFLTVCSSLPSLCGDSFVSYQNFHIVVFEYAQAYKWLNEESMVKAVGIWFGKSHQLSQKYTKEHIEQANKIRNWDCLHEGVMKDAVISDIDKSFENDPTKYGICHGDVNPSNFFYDEQTEQVFMFDFDQLQKSWYLYDLAQSCFTPYMLKGAGSPFGVAVPKELNPDQYKNWLVESYESILGQNTVDREALDRMISLRKNFYGTKAVKELEENSEMGKFCNFIVDWLDNEEKT